MIASLRWLLRGWSSLRERIKGLCELSLVNPQFVFASSWGLLRLLRFSEKDSKTFQSVFWWSRKHTSQKFVVWSIILPITKHEGLLLHLKTIKDRWDMSALISTHCTCCLYQWGYTSSSLFHEESMVRLSTNPLTFWAKEIIGWGVGRCVFYAKDGGTTYPYH